MYPGTEAEAAREATGHERDRTGDRQDDADTVAASITNAAVRSARVNPPIIDLLAADFYVDGARDAYAWMREHAPVHCDEANNLWGVATYAGVMAVGRDPATYSSAGGSRPDTGPMPWMIDMDAPSSSR